MNCWNTGKRTDEDVGRARNETASWTPSAAAFAGMTQLIDWRDKFAEGDNVYRALH